MKTFTIDGNSQILVFASKKEAAAASVTDTFATQNELAELTTEFPMQRLVGIWNAIPGVTTISKFTSRKIAIERLWKAIQGLEVSAKPEASVAEPVAEATIQAESVPEPEAAVQPQEAPVQPIEAPVVEPEVLVEQPEAQAPAQAMEPVADAGAQVADVAPAAETPKQKATRAKKTPKAKAKTEKQDSGPREGSKTAQVVAMLQREGGATISEIMKTMGWQKHTVRGFMAGTMKKAGYTVESFKPEGGERTYRIPK